jgi:hypothetical protein
MGYTVVAIGETQISAQVRAEDLKVMPLNFALSFLQFPGRSGVPPDLAPERLSRRGLRELKGK